MDNELFRKEMHEYIDKSYNDFVSYKSVIYDIFKEFHRVCEKNDIVYYTAFGTLLSIVRDGTLIVPWDKDADVLLPIKEKEKLIFSLSNDLNEDYFFMCQEVDPNYRLLMLRVGKKGYELETFHVDVFYLVGVSEEKDQQEIMRKAIRKLIRKKEISVHFKNRRIVENLNGRKHLNLSVLKYKIVSVFYHINKEFDEICSRYPFDTARCYITIGFGAEAFPKEIFEARKKIVIEGLDCYIPNKSEDFLIYRYGNYKAMFPISNRFDEFYNGYKDIIQAVYKKNLSVDRTFILKD